MLRFHPTLQTFEERLAPATLSVKLAGYTVAAIVLPPSDGGETTVTPIDPTPTVPPPPPPPPPGTGGM